jgi:hypothetical protein
MYRSTVDDPAAPERDLGELPLEHLEAELCELAAHLGAGMARWIALVDEYDHREGWGSWSGVKSTSHWISWRCACSTRAAREHVRVARALRELPLTREAFGRGQISYSKVRTLTRVAAAESEEFLLHQATYATASQLDRMLSAYERSEREERGEPELRWHWNRDGSLSVEARLAPDDGRAFLDALEAARSKIRDEAHNGGDENGPAGPFEPLLGDVATNAEALSTIAESYLAHGPLERVGPQRQQLIVHVDVETLNGGPGRSQLEHGPAIAPETACRLGCDASLQVLVKRGRKALYLGRKTRAISPALNLTLRERDRGCRFPGCDNHRWVDAHHIVHWARGGETGLDNLVLLCRRHHRLVHEGGFSLTGDANEELVFRDPHGERLENAPRPPRGSPAELIERNRSAGLEVAAETLLTGTGERMDLHACVDAVGAACS